MLSHGAFVVVFNLVMYMMYDRNKYCDCYRTTCACICLFLFSFFCNCIYIVSY